MNSSPLPRLRSKGSNFDNVFFFIEFYLGFLVICIFSTFLKFYVLDKSSNLPYYLYKWPNYIIHNSQISLNLWAPTLYHTNFTKILIPPHNSLFLSFCYF